MSTRPHSPSLHRLTFVSARNQDLVAEYLVHLRTRHSSPKTLQTTLGALVTFYRLLPPARQPSLWQDVTRLTPADVDAWLEAAQRHGLAPSTIHTTLSVVRRFCTFLQEHGLLVQQPIHPRRHAVLLPQMLPRPMAEEDLIRFFQVIDVLRDRAMFLLMLRCGLRVGEVASLPWSAIDWTQGTIRVDNSKGRVDRVVYVSPDLVLRQWRRAQWPPMPALFPSPSLPGAPVSVRSIQRVMTQYLKRAGIAKTYSPHTLRHTFATQLLNAGTALEVVKELMGHRSITLTLRYAQVYDTTKRTPYTQAMAQIESRQAL
jgi:site-specific recombinase XerD